MIQAKGYAVQSATSPLAPFAFTRRVPGPNDVHIEILYCGICHTDLHQCRNDWGGSTYPMVPGHEIIGRVKAVGAAVTKLKAGDFAGVGCMVDSCRQCAACQADLEQYCENGTLWTYNSKQRDTNETTYGGYSDQIVVEERFVVKVQATLDLKETITVHIIYHLNRPFLTSIHRCIKKASVYCSTLPSRSVDILCNGLAGIHRRMGQYRLERQNG